MPSEDQIIWRYMDLPKYMSLLTENRLWFARGDTFEDKWEGFSHALPLDRRLHRESAKNPQVAEDYIKLVEEHNDALQVNKSMFVSCWTAELFESIPLWKIYAPSNSGIAIKSSVARFQESVQISRFFDFFYGNVSYFDKFPPDYNYSDEVSFNWPKACVPYFRKRKYFEYKKEWRAVGVGRDQDDDQNTGILVDVELNRLVEKVVVSPLADDRYLDVVRTVTQRLGLKAEAERSRFFGDAPVWKAPFS